jgi:hypothetical protein
MLCIVFSARGLFYFANGQYWDCARSLAAEELEDGGIHQGFGAGGDARVGMHQSATSANIRAIEN